MSALDRAQGSECNSTAWLVRARKRYRCQDSREVIEAGTLYVRMVAFPGHDAVGGTRPWVLKVCLNCATRYGRALPDRRTKGAMARMAWQKKTVEAAGFTTRTHLAKMDGTVLPRGR